MNEIRTRAVAEITYERIQRDRERDSKLSAQLKAASNRIMVELRSGNPYVYLISSDRHEGAFMIHDPPLTVHFAVTAPGEIAIIDWEDNRPLHSLSRRKPDCVEGIETPEAMALTDEEMRAMTAEGLTLDDAIAVVESLGERHCGEI